MGNVIKLLCIYFDILGGILINYTIMENIPSYVGDLVIDFLGGENYVKIKYRSKKCQNAI